MKITIYTTPTCPYCHQAKDYLDDKKLEYKEIDVSQNEAGLEEMIKLSSQMGVPVIVVDGKVIVGFDQSKLDKILTSR